MINKKQLKAAMVLFGDTQQTLAEALGISRITLSGKVNGKRFFTLNEVNVIRKRYNLSLDAVAAIFFGE